MAIILASQQRNFSAERGRGAKNRRFSVATPSQTARCDQVMGAPEKQRLRRLGGLIYGVSQPSARGTEGMALRKADQRLSKKPS